MDSGNARGPDKRQTFVPVRSARTTILLGISSGIPEYMITYIQGLARSGLDWFSLRLKTTTTYGKEGLTCLCLICPRRISGVR